MVAEAIGPKHSPAWLQAFKEVASGTRKRDRSGTVWHMAGAGIGATLLDSDAFRVCLADDNKKDAESVADASANIKVHTCLLANHGLAAILEPKSQYFQSSPKPAGASPSVLRVVSQNAEQISERQPGTSFRCSCGCARRARRRAATARRAPSSLSRPRTRSHIPCPPPPFSPAVPFCATLRGAATRFRV